MERTVDVDGKMFNGKTAEVLKSTAMMMYPVHMILLTSSTMPSWWIIESDYTVVKASQVVGARKV